MSDLPSIGRIVDREHLLPVRVYYEDTDFTGVVYHATYLRFFERGRSEMLRVMGVPPDQPDHGIFAVTRIVIDYRAPARIHDALLVRTAFEGMKGPRLNFRQRGRAGRAWCWSRRRWLRWRFIRTGGRVNLPLRN